jgi:hypothetical protein
MIELSEHVSLQLDLTILIQSAELREFQPDEFSEKHFWRSGRELFGQAEIAIRSLG